MGPEVTWVRYGRSGAEQLRSAIADAKAGEPLRPVSVIVPSNHVGVATRRLLASGVLGPICGTGAGLAAVTFLTVYRLAELLGAPKLAAAGRRPVSTPVLAAAMRAALAREPGVFGPVAAHPATEQALVAAYRELRDLAEPALAAVARAGDRAATVVRLHRAVREALASGWYDEQDLMAAACGAAAPVELGAVIVYLPQALSGPAVTLLRSLPDLRVVAATTGDERADGAVLTTVGRLVGADALAPAEESGWVVDGERTQFVSASDADDEVRAAVRAVAAAVDGGTRLDRIAVLHASPVPYARLVHEHLAAAAIPANGASVVPLSARVAGRTLLRLLAIPEGGARREDVFAWLTAAPIFDGARPAPVNEWERLSREAAVVAGRNDWDQRLLTLAASLEQQAASASADPEAEDWRVERLRRQAAEALRLRAFVLGLLAEVGPAQVRSWGEHAAWAASLLGRLLGPPEQRTDWPEAEGKAAERVELALARLGALDEVEGPIPLEAFGRTLALELEADLGRVGRFGDGVLVGSVAMGVGLDLDLVVVLGLAEGLFPSGVHEDSLLPDSERERADGGLPLKRQRVDREHRELLAALAGAHRHVLCLPRGDLRRSSSHVPSRWAIELAMAADGRSGWDPDVLTAQRPWIEHVPSFDAGLRRLSAPATAQEHRLRELLARPGALIDMAPLALDMVRARRSTEFTRFDGNLAGLAIPSPVGAPTSATRLERWIDCPFAYFAQDLLKVERVENPEEELHITPRDRGDLVHRILELFILYALTDRPGGPPSPPEPWSHADRRVLMDITDAQFAEFTARGLTGRPIFRGRDAARLRRELARFLELDDLYRAQHGTRPVAAELAFGLPGSGLPAVSVPLPDGQMLRIRGKADRVDRSDDGALHIVDYKTGSTRGYEGLCSDDPDLSGAKLQLPIYGLAARAHAADPDATVVAEYWFVSNKAKFKRIGFPVSDSVLKRVSDSLGAIVAGIEGGVFPNHPSEGTTPWNQCWFCDPDYLGMSELRGQWERKRSDAALVAYAGRVEPDGEDA